MCAVIAAILFALAAIISGANLHPDTAVLSWQTLVAAGLVFLALHGAPKWK
jgi:hypothetical protein